MASTRQQIHRTAVDERGAALIVSLILLLIMTIIGISAMNSARLEVSMAGMMQREEVALRKAERALVVAEEYVEVTPGPFDEMSPGHYLPEDEVDVSVTDWSDIVRKVKSEEIPDLSAEDAFIVEYQGEVTLPGSALNDGGDTIPGDKVNVYRITTRSETEGKAVRIVESNYTKLYNPMEP